MKTTYTYDHYFKYDEIKTILESLGTANLFVYPNSFTNSGTIFFS